MTVMSAFYTLALDDSNVCILYSGSGWTWQFRFVVFMEMTISISGLLDYNAVKYCIWSPTFWRNVLFPFSR
jgi:hypothetical protein